MRGHGLDCSGWGWRHLAGCCECGNEPLGSIKCWKFLTSWGPISSSRTTVFHGAGHSPPCNVCVWNSDSSVRSFLELCPVPALTKTFTMFHTHTHTKLLKLSFKYFYFVFSLGKPEMKVSEVYDNELNFLRRRVKTFQLHSKPVTPRISRQRCSDHNCHRH